MRFLIVTSIVLLAGCATRTIEVAPIVIAPIDVTITGPSRPEDLKPSALGDTLTKQAFGADSVAGQISLGCAGYLRAAGRWPKTKEEVAEGLAAEKLAANHLAELQGITFTEEKDSLVVEFSAGGNGTPSGTIRMHAPKKEEPISERSAAP